MYIYIYIHMYISLSLSLSLRSARQEPPERCAQNIAEFEKSLQTYSVVNVERALQNVLQMYCKYIAHVLYVNVERACKI